MKSIFFSCAVFFLLTFSASGELRATESKGKLIGISQERGHPSWWKQSFLDIADDASEAAEEGKQLIVYFYLDGCPYCTKMAREHFTKSPYIDFIKDNFDVIAINVLGSLEVTRSDGSVMTEKELSEKLNVRFTPGMLFFDGSGNQVLRLDGYRNQTQFEQVLRYVATRSYLTQSLSKYLARLSEEKDSGYTFIKNNAFVDTYDLGSLPDKPIMVIFEDKSCYVECTEFHNKFLASSEAQSLMSMMSVVRWDANSKKTITDHKGNKTTVRDFADSQNIVYRPGVLVIDGGVIKARRNSYTVLHHFLGGLEYIATRSYMTQSRSEFSREREARILDSGQNIDLRI